MRKRIMTFILAVSVLLIAMPILAFASGDGTENNPYLISTYEELVTFREKINSGTQVNACAKLIADINLSSEANWTPIGTGNGDIGVNAYKGIFDGNGYEIKNMRIITSEFYRGLFGYTDKAVIQNLKVSGEVKAGARSAGFVGCALDTTIKNCANNVNVTCNDAGASGFIGYNRNGSKTASKVENSYSLGNINGTVEVTGIMLWGTVTNCYAYGDIVGSGNAFRLSAGTVTNSYYKSCTPVTGGGGTQKNSDAFASGEVAYLLGDAFGQAIGTDVYPVFRTETNVVFKNGDSYSNDSETEEPNPGEPDDDLEITGGDGTENNPYIISTYEELVSFRDKVNGGTQMDACAKLTADIDLGGNVWTPIGKSGTPYKGIFDGNGHCVKNINVTGGTYLGFFGQANGATIKNFGVESGSVIGDNGQYVGGIAGYISDTTIDLCYNGADISAAARVSGISGSSENSVITNCYNVGNVTGNTEVSAICFLGATIENCYTYGRVTSAANMWLFGANNIKTNCYALIDSYSAPGHLDTGGATTKTKNDFANGSLVSLLGDKFGQLIGIDEYPVARTEDNVVEKGATGYFNTYAIPEVTAVEFVREGGTVFTDKSAVSRYTTQIVIKFNSRIEADTINGMVSLGSAEFDGEIGEDSKSYVLTLKDGLEWGEYTLSVKKDIKNFLGNTMTDDYTNKITVADTDEAIITKAVANTKFSDITDGKEASVSIKGYNPYGTVKHITVAMVGYTEVNGIRRLEAFSHEPVTLTEDGGETFDMVLSLDSTEFSNMTEIKLFVWNYPIQKELIEPIIIK